MKIIRAYPPNFAQIAAAFPVKGRPGILYAYGDRLYNPSGIAVTPWLLTHETVHSVRQLVQAESGWEHDAAGWWDLYINSLAFRFTEELKAHQAEYHEYAGLHTEADTEKYLAMISQRLASRLYGSMVSEQEARDAIAGGNPGQEPRTTDAA